jgi:hypothetical protein
MFYFILSPMVEADSEDLNTTCDALVHVVTLLRRIFSLSLSMSVRGLRFDPTCVIYLLMIAYAKLP